MTGVSADTFNKNLDIWLNTVPEQSKAGGYSRWVAAKSNSIHLKGVPYHSDSLVFTNHSIAQMNYFQSEILKLH